MSKNLKLKGAIVENGYTYEALADDVGCTTPTIQRAVNNENISLDVAQKICKGLGYTLTDLFSEQLNKKGEV